MQSNHFRFFINFRNGILGIAVAIAVLGCNTPLQSQKYFAQAVKDDPIMEPLHQTALYTVYFDHALQRCVMHSSYTWGESGGGTGGTGLGVNVFNCNPQALKAHADRLRAQIENGTDYFELPVPKVRRTKPTSDKQRGGIQKRIKMTPTAQSPGLSQGASKLPVRPAPSVNTTQSGAADAQPASSAEHNTQRMARMPILLARFASFDPPPA